MPILGKEENIYPEDLLDNQALLEQSDRDWFCVYTLARREKELARRLIAKQVCCYLPIVPRRFRSPSGRLRTSYVPLFANYLFLYADQLERHFCLDTKCVSQIRSVNEPERLVGDLRLISLAIDQGVPLTPEARIEPGQKIRVRTGPFRGYEGEVIRREGKTRLLLSIQFVEQCVSMEVDEAILEAM